MIRGLLADVDFRAQFSGHETFTVRYGWLNKVFDAVSATEAGKNPNPFLREDAIASFGVGKNMVASIKHWGLAAGVIETNTSGYRVSSFGRQLMGEGGLDPYLESQTSLWLLHWKLVSSARRATTWYWAFNHFSALLFDHDGLTKDLQQLCQDRSWKVSHTTLRRDVECFIKMYSPSVRAISHAVTEDTLESPFCELGLIKPTGFKGGHQFQRGPKSSLNDFVFLYALDGFWKSYTTSGTLTVEAVAYEPGSPGRIFKLDEDSVADRLSRVEEYSSGIFGWTDTAGLRQVVRKKDEINLPRILRRAFSGRRPVREAA